MTGREAERTEERRGGPDVEPQGERPGERPFIMVVDDERTFDFGDIGAEVFYARSAGVALGMLWTRSDYDEIWLDHDLGPDGGDVMEVVRALAREPRLYRVGAVWVHSQNPPGADNIVFDLKRHYRVARQPLPPLDRGSRGAQA